MKMLYETTVKKLIEEPFFEQREENGEKVEVKKTKKSIKLIKFAVLKPDRKISKAAEMFYAKTLSEYIKMGLMPFSLVAKRYANDGGVLTEKEKERISALKEEARTLEKFFFTEISDDPAIQKKKNDCLIRINEINMEVNNISNSYSDIYDTTAEVKARNDTMEWWVLNLMYVEQDNKFVPFFGDGSLEDKFKKLEEMEEQENEFNLEAIKKLSFLVSFWVTARNQVSELDFKAMDKMYDETISTYKVDVTESVKVTDLTPQVPPQVTEKLEEKPIETKT